ncbi:COG2426 family protein [Pumilibacter intestinalis]|uniref:COG2426 family protein n=1 Tax=Pumilibacter intestinalis TaxID=2941511 RepID=UPI002041A563|nr:small multi-drug export protein [Pumilibacter intestinalis]
MVALMICGFTDVITQALLKVFRLPELVTIFISVLPIVEARGAIPIAFGYGIKPPFALLYAFIGSSLMAPILIAVLLPFVKWLSRTKIFRKVGQVIYEKFEKKAQSISTEGTTDSPVIARSEAPKQSHSKSPKPSDLKKMLGVFAFVAIPLPLTGVWTGSAVAAVTGLKYPKALAAVVAGNLVATAIITLLCWFFSDYIDWIILAIGIIAVIVVTALIIKIILHKSPEQSAETDQTEEQK